MTDLSDRLCTAARQLEVESRRSDRPHPDSLDKLEILGANFAVSAPTARVEVKLNSCGRADIVCKQPDEQTELSELAEQILSRSRGRNDQLDLDIDRDGELISRIASFSAAMVKKQYTLSDDQISELLSFKLGENPQWLSQAAKMILNAAGKAPVKKFNWLLLAVNVVKNILAFVFRAKAAKKDSKNA